MFKLTIKVGPNVVDYSGYLDWNSIQVTEQTNQPTKFQFTLNAYDWKFRMPVQRAYVRLYPSSSNRPIFTGFLAVEPTKTFVGLSAAGFRILGPTGNNLLNNAGQILSIACIATSDEYLLALKAVPFIPTYINQTQGQILRNLANTLCPGYFDTSNIQDGDVVPSFNYDPTKAWHEVAKTFGDASRFRYKAIDRKLFYVPYGDNDLGLTYDEVNQKEGQFDPTALQMSVLQVPTVNDVTIIGDAEGGNNHEDYFVGDGFTGNLQLKHKVFLGSSVVLLQDPLTQNELNSQNWYQQDPGSNFDYSAGAFNVVTPQTEPFNANGTSYLGAQNGVELAGGVNLQHGEFIFDDYCSGVLGGIYEDQTYLDTKFVCGFKLTSLTSLTTSASGAYGVEITPYFGDTPLTTPFNPAVISQPNHTYALQTLIHAPAYTRWTQMYRTIDGEEYGGGSLTMTGSVTFNVQDYDIGAATGFYYTPNVSSYTIQNVELPDFGAYALVNNDVLNITDTNVLIAKMPLGGLYGLLGDLGLVSPSGLVLPALQENWLNGIPPSGNYFFQSVPAVPQSDVVNNVNPSPHGNQYYIGSVSTWGIAIASSQSGGTPGSLVQQTTDLNFTSGWSDYGPGDVAIDGAVTYDSTKGPGGGPSIVDVSDRVTQSHRFYGNFDLISTYGSPNFDTTINGSQNANNDKLVLSIMQTQAVQNGLTISFTDNASNSVSYGFAFDPNSCFNAWITVTAVRSAFNAPNNFNWAQITRIEMFGDATPPPYQNYTLNIAEGRFVGLVPVAPTSPTTTTSFISLLTDPLFNVMRFLSPWNNQSDSLQVTVLWAVPVGHPQIPGSMSIEAGIEGGSEAIGQGDLQPGESGLAFRAEQQVNITGVSISPGDQFTIGIYAKAQISGGTFPLGLELVFGISAIVTYTDGTTSSAAAGGAFPAPSRGANDTSELDFDWTSSANQLVTDPVRTVQGITVTIFAYEHNPTPTHLISDAGWTIWMTAAEMIKTPSAYNVYSSPVGLSQIPTNLVLGNGFDLQAAQITQGNDADILAFYGQTLPTAGTPVRFQSWESQAAVSRLQDTNAIAYEAYITEDDGIRAAIVSNISPLPRTSEDADNAAQAFLADRTTVDYNGTYTCSSKFFSPPVIVIPNDGYGQGGYGLTPYGGTILDDQYWPTTGRFFHVNAPPRGIVNQKFLVTQVQFSITDPVTELVKIQLTFGTDLQLEKVLHNFVDLQPASVLTPSDKANPPDPRNVVDVTTSYLDDLANTFIPLGGISPTQVYVYCNDIIPAGAWIEVRLLDSNWGDMTKRDFIGRFNPVQGNGFTLKRQGYDQQWFMRLVADGSTDSGSTSMTYTISGNVISSPVGASILLVELDILAISDDSGNWSFDGLPNGTYSIRPSINGYNFTPAVQQVVINGANVSGLHFIASLTTYTVMGYVVDNNSNPVTSATVSWTGTASGSTFVSANGSYAFSVSSGSYTITASATNYTSQSSNQTVTNRNLVGISFVLLPPNTTGGIFKYYYNGDIADTTMPASLSNEFTSDPSPSLVSFQTPPGLEISGTGSLTITSGGHSHGPFTISSATGSVQTYLLKTPISVSSATFTISGGDGNLTELYVNATSGVSAIVGFPRTLVADDTHQSYGVGDGSFSFLDWSGTGNITLTLKEYDQDGSDVTVSGVVPEGVNLNIGVFTGFDPDTGDPQLASGSVTLTTASPSATISYSGPLYIIDNSTDNSVKVFIAVS